jgi:hypothetical protein
MALHSAQMVILLLAGAAGGDRLQGSSSQDLQDFDSGYEHGIRGVIPGSALSQSGPRLP